MLTTLPRPHHPLLVAPPPARTNAALQCSSFPSPNTHQVRVGHDPAPQPKQRAVSVLLSGAKRDCLCTVSHLTCRKTPPYALPRAAAINDWIPRSCQVAAPSLPRSSSYSSNTLLRRGGTRQSAMRPRTCFWSAVSTPLLRVRAPSCIARARRAVHVAGAFVRQARAATLRRVCMRTAGRPSDLPPLSRYFFARARMSARQRAVRKHCNCC